MLLDVSATQMEALFDELWPLCRSLTGKGIQDSFKILKKIIPLEIESYPTGTQVFDWEIPKEWNIRDAYVEDSKGNRVIDFKENNLSVVSYSVPVDTVLSLDELLPRLHSLPTLPTAIPYRTTYYKEDWGFCLTENSKRNLKPGNYRVRIDSDLKPGDLNIGQCVLPSTEGEHGEILVSSYLCHPSMANNELSGPIALAFLYKKLESLPRRKWNYRFYVGPETIGSIAFLSRHGKTLKQNCIGGLVLTCCGDANHTNYKRTRSGNSSIDRIAENVLKSDSDISPQLTIRDYFPTGSDERQFCSPGFDLPVGSFIRSMYGEFPEYHTSLDDKSFISFEALQKSVEMCFDILRGMEANVKYARENPYCEPMLSKRGLYPTAGAAREIATEVLSMLYILNYSDGKHDLVDIANRAKRSVIDLIPLVEKLKSAGLIHEVNGND